MLKGSADAIVLMQVRDGNEKIKELTQFLKEASTAAVEAVMDINVSTQLDDILGNENEASSANQNHPIEIDLLRGRKSFDMKKANRQRRKRKTWHENLHLFLPFHLF